MLDDDGDTGELIGLILSVCLRVVPCHVVSDRPFAGSLEAHPKLPPVLTGALAVLRGAVGVL